MRQRQTINQPADIELSGKSLKSFIALNEADAEETALVETSFGTTEESVL